MYSIVTSLSGFQTVHGLRQFVPSRPRRKIKRDVTRQAKPQASRCHSISAYRPEDAAGVETLTERCGKQSGEQVLLLVNFRNYARRSPKGPEEAPIYIVQSERTTNSRRKMFSSFKRGVPSTGNLQAISLLPVMLWQYQREVWRSEILKFMCYC